MSAGAGDTVAMDGSGDEGGGATGHAHHRPHWESPPHTSASRETSLQEKTLRLQQAIEQGDVQLAMQWATQLASQKAKLNVSVHADQDNELEETISVKIHIENKDSSICCTTLDLRPSITIATLKLMMLECHGFPPEVQTWIIGGRMVRDDETLVKCGIKFSGSSIFLYLLSAQSVGLTQEEFRTKYGHLVKPGTPGLPRSLLVTSNHGNKTVPNTLVHPAVPWDQESANVPVTIQQSESLREESPRVLTPPRDTSAKPRPPVATKPPAPVPAPRGKPPVVSEEDRKQEFGWDCTVCTFKNWPTWPGCEICDSSRPDGYKVPADYKLSKRELERMEKEQQEEAAARVGESHSQATPLVDNALRDRHDVLNVDQELAMHLSMQYIKQNPSMSKTLKESGINITDLFVKIGNVDPLEAAGTRQGTLENTGENTGRTTKSHPPLRRLSEGIIGVCKPLELELTTESQQESQPTTRTNQPVDMSSSISMRGPLFDTESNPDSDSDNDIVNQFV